MSRARSFEQLETLGAAAVLLSAFAVSCGYDFNQFVREPTGGAPSAGHGSVASGGTAGHGGASGRAATGGNGESAGAADAGEGGVSGSSTSSGSGGEVASGGRSGSANGGVSGKTGAAGKSGTAGTTSSAGQGGAHSTAGNGGASASAGAAGKPSTSCSGTSYGGHCYFLIGTDTALDWPSAKSTCEAHSSKTHLVTITSTDEQAALAKAFFPSQADTWIGLSLADPSKSPDSTCKLLPDQCPFKWVTGETLSYTNWAMRSGSDNEPNYTGSCVRLQAADESWADTGCTTSKNRAICEED